MSEHPLVIDGWHYTLTTRHPASSFGIPVLVAPDGTAEGPDDTGELRLEKASDEAVRSLTNAGFTFDDCRPERH